MTKNYFYIALFAVLLSSCEKDSLVQELPDNSPIASGLVSGAADGETDGVTYSLNGISISPNLVTINENQAKFESTEQELSLGTIKLTDVSTEVSSALAVGKILYVKTGNYTGLKKIMEVKTGENGAYQLETTQALLGEAFDEGTLGVSIDLYKASVAHARKTGLRSAFGEQTHEILNLQEEYDLGYGIKYNPATNLKLVYNLQLTFSKTQILPSEFSNTFEIQIASNPAFNFVGSINKIYKNDVSQYIPQELIDYIKTQEFDLDIPINLLGIETLPAKVKIEDIHIPIELEANLSQQSLIGFGLNGVLKTGYKIKINGLTAKTTPIYENTLVATNPSTTEIYGELLTDAKIILTPNISILDNSYNVSGDISLGLKTTTYGNVTLPGQAPVFGSQGITTSEMNVLVDLILLKIPVKVFSTEEVKWNIGTIVKSVTYSDLGYTFPSSYTDNSNVLTWGLINRAYNVDFKLFYKYPILGKVIPSELLFSYDIYEENGTTKIASVKDEVITPANVTANSFQFKQNIPFRGVVTIVYKKVLGVNIPIGTTTTYQTKSYIKNIVIKDHKGYVYNGIYNTSKGIVENSIEIKH